MSSSERSESPGVPIPSGLKEQPAGRHARRKRIVIAVCLALLAMLVAAAGCAYYEYGRVASRLAPSDSKVRAETEKVLTPTTTLEREDPQYILMLGEDRKPRSERRTHADTILVLRLDPAAKRISMLSIPRDTRMNIPGRGMDKITNANVFGGPPLVVNLIKQYTGLPIHHYVEIDFTGFTQVVDAMGGVWINVDREIWDRAGAFPFTEGLSSVTRIRKGYQKLNAAQALTFVRSRRFAEGDYVRVEHQRQFLVAVMKQALQPDQLSRLPGIAVSAAEHIDTDMSIPELVQLASRYRDVASEDVVGYTAPGTSRWIDGVAYVIPDAKASKAFFKAFQRGEEPTKTP